jgi:hypothetical protein
MFFGGSCLFYVLKLSIGQSVLSRGILIVRDTNSELGWIQVLIEYLSKS